MASGLEVELSSQESDYDEDKSSEQRPSRKMRSIGIQRIKFQELEVEFRGSIDVSTEIGRLERRFYKTLLKDITRSLKENWRDRIVVLEAGNNRFVSHSGNEFVNRNTSEEASWRLIGVESVPSAEFIHTINNRFRWRFNPESNTITLELNSGRTDRSHWFVVDDANTNTIAPFTQQRASYVTNVNTTFNRPFLSLPVFQQFNEDDVVTVDDPLGQTRPYCIPAHQPKQPPGTPPPAPTPDSPHTTAVASNDARNIISQ